MNEKLHELASDARLLSAFESVIAPMLNRMLNDRIEAIRQKVRTGNTIFIVECTEIALIRDLMTEIETHKRRGHVAANKLGVESEFC